MNCSNRLPKLFCIRDCDTISDDIYYSLLEHTSTRRRHNLESYHHKEDRFRSVIAEAIARFAVCNATDLNYQNVTIRTGENGKPFVREFAGDFNISHSEGWVVCGIDTSAIGVDIEKIQPIDLNIANEFFSPLEIDELHSLPENRMLDRFYSLWTLKESYMKMTGEGLSLALNSYAISFAQEIPQIIGGSAFSRIRFKEFEIDKEYKCSVCYSRDVMAIEPMIFSPTELLEAISNLSEYPHKGFSCSQHCAKNKREENLYA